MFEESLTCPSQDSTASSSVVMFESAMADTPQPRKPMTPLRTAEQLDTDEPLDRSHFAVYGDNLPEWQMISESYTTHRKDLHTRIVERLKELQDLEAWYETKNGEFHAKVEEAYLRQSDELVQQKSVLDMDKQKHERDRELVLEVKRLQSEKIKLNVGGQIFVTSITTLTKDPDSLLARMFGPNGTAVPEADGSYFIDRDGTYFRYVLNYLRDLTIPESVRQDHKIMDELIQEAQYYQIKGLLKLKWTNLPLITQHELHEMYPRPTMVAPSDEMVHAHHAAVVFHLEGKDLSGLDFSYYHIDPRSSFAGSNLENARFDKAWFMFDFEQKVNFSDTYLVGATFPRVDDLNRVQTSPDVQFNFEGAIKDDHEY